MFDEPIPPLLIMSLSLFIALVLPLIIGAYWDKIKRWYTVKVTMYNTLYGIINSKRQNAKKRAEMIKRNRERKKAKK